MTERDEEHAPRVLSYASPRTDRSLGLGFLSPPPPGRLAAEIGLIALTLGIIGRHENTWWTSVYLGTAVVTWTVGRWAYRRVTPPAHSDALNQRWWRFTAWLCLAMLTLSVRVDQCPHAKYLMIGPLPIVQGRPCANPRDYKHVLRWLVEP